MWHRFNPNPRGSSVGDCAVRAVAAATGRSWEQTYIALALTGYAIGDMPSANRTWGAYLQKQGYKRRMVEADCTTCYTVADFAREYPRGVYVLGCSGHVLTVIDGEWWDSWDSGAECPLCGGAMRKAGKGGTTWSSRCCLLPKWWGRWRLPCPER